MTKKQLNLIEKCINECKNRLILYAGKNEILINKGYDQKQADSDRMVIEHFERVKQMNV